MEMYNRAGTIYCHAKRDNLPSCQKGQSTVMLKGTFYCYAKRDNLPSC